MWQKIVSFFMSIVAFFMQLFGLGGAKKTYNEYRDVQYGNDKNQVIDMALPTDAGDSMGLYVFIHGGAWLSGDEDDGWDLVKYCANDLKIAAVSVNYRFISAGGSVHSNEMVADVANAVTAAVNKAKEQGITITSIAVSGYSAGAHLAMMYAYTKASSAPAPIKFVVSSVGPCDFTGTTFVDHEVANGSDEAYVYLLLSELCGVTVTKDNISTAAVQLALAAVSPISYINSDSVPTLMAYGEKDALVPYSSAQKLNTVLTLMNVKHEFFSYPNSGHDLDKDSDIAAAFNEKQIEYVNTYLK